MSARHRFDLHEGAQWDGAKTAFRFRAPDAQAVVLEIEGHAPLPMQRSDDGMFTAEAGCDPGALYRYRVGDLAVPDPLSRRQPQGVHGPSEVIDPEAYMWRAANWRGRPWHEMVIYELHVGCLGGYEGVRKHLAHLARTGYTAIELMPLAEFAGARNWGYDGVLPYAPASAYGSPDQLKATIDAAHELGLCVYLDVVYNHFGPEGNYLHAYAKGFFRKEVSAWGERIDFDCPAVRRYFIDNALYWLLEYRFDGLRFDAAHAIHNDGFLREMAREIRSRIEPGRQVHLMLENEHNTASLMTQGYDAQWNDDGHNVLHVLLTGETRRYYRYFAEEPTARLAKCLSSGFIYQGDIPDPDGAAARGEPSSELPPSAFVLFLQNHDQVGNRADGRRLRSLCTPEALRAAITLQLLGPQIPLQFMGEEYGSRTPFFFFVDFPEPLASQVDEGRRREMGKDAPGSERGIGFPPPNDIRTFRGSAPDFTLESDSEDGQDWLHFHKHLLTIRHGRIVPGLPGAVSAGAQVLGDKAVSASWRLGNGALLTLMLNLGDAPLTIEALPGELLFDSRAWNAPAPGDPILLLPSACRAYLGGAP